jgi:superfamily I DNA/RNA helicase
MEVSGADQDGSLREWAHSLDRCVDRAKNTLATTAEEIDNLIDDMDLDPPEEPKDMHRCMACGRWSPIDRDNLTCGHKGCVGQMVIETKNDRPEFIRQVLECMERSTYDLVKRTDRDGNVVYDRIEPRTIDFACMIYLPVALEIRMPKYQMVFIDETQDLNALQIKLALSICARGGRIIAVGDDRQGIYGFRGAARGALDRVVKELGAKVMPMTMTYRCGTNIVAEAQKIVPDIQAAPGMHQGSVEDHVSHDRMLRDAKPGDFILSRANAPLLGLCLEFIRDGRRANILGRDIGARLSLLVRKAKTQDIGELATWVKNWADKEAERMEKKGESAQRVRDQQECLVVLMEGARNTMEVHDRIARLFDDPPKGATDEQRKRVDESRITLSTTHKAKGMERDRVWVLRDTYWGAERDPMGEEGCLLYVAVTRAKHALFFVRGKRVQHG